MKTVREWRWSTLSHAAARGLAMVALASAANAAPAVIDMHVGDVLGGARYLGPSTHRYVRYDVGTDGHRTLIDLWTRVLTQEPGADGRPRLHLHQEWVGAAKPGQFLYKDAWFEPTTLAPLEHIWKIVPDPAQKVAGFHFSRDRIVGITDLPGNKYKDFSVETPDPQYDFDADMEYLAALPLAAGQTYRIPFFDPGAPEQAPARYTYRVAGSDIVDLGAGPVDCWLVTFDLEGQGSTRFWFSKATHVLLREQSSLPDGRTLLKLLLPAESDA